MVNLILSGCIQIMNRNRKEVFGNGNNLIDLIYSYENGIILAYSNETELIKIIEKMRDDKIERLLQLRNEDEYIRFVARVMLELWG